MSSEGNPTAPRTALRDLADRRGLLIGAAVSEGPLRDDPVYREILPREFNLVTCENAMKFGPLRPTRDQFAFEAADTIVRFAQENGMAVRGHTLLWHRMLPSWLLDGPFTYDACLDVVRDHIYTVTQHYRGKVQAWDVVNEAMDDDGTYRDTPFLRAFGPDYVSMAFHWAHEADPDANLFYNDYCADVLNVKSDGIYRMVTEMVQSGVPIHGVGLQMHLNLADPPDLRSVAQNIERFNALGLDVQVTEMDVQVCSPASEEDLRKEARLYGDIVGACLAARRCTAFVTWGVTDRYSWIPESFPGYGTPLLFDHDGRPKPAYNAVRDALNQRGPAR